MHKQKKEIVILSAERPNENNKLRTSILKNMLIDLNIPFEACEGMYEGKKENSFICIVKNETELEVLAQIAFNQFNQESILFRDFKGFVSFIEPKKIKYTNCKLKKVTEKEAKECNAYTKKADNSFWIITK